MKENEIVAKTILFDNTTQSITMNTMLREQLIRQLTELPKDSPLREQLLLVISTYSMFLSEMTNHLKTLGNIDKPNLVQIENPINGEVLKIQVVYYAGGTDIKSQKPLKVNGTVILGNQIIDLTPTENITFRTIVEASVIDQEEKRKKKQYVTKSEIGDALSYDQWDEGPGIPAIERTVSRLRDKLDPYYFTITEDPQPFKKNAPDPRSIIRTIRGMNGGYVLNTDIYSVLFSDDIYVHQPSLINENKRQMISEIH